MANNLAEYFTDELIDWREIINTDDEEIVELKERLYTLLHRDSIPGLAAHVEHFMNNLELQQQNFYSQAHEIQLQESKLMEDDMPVANQVVTEDLKTKQRKLRLHMQSLEKQYIDLRYECQDFISNMLSK